MRSKGFTNTLEGIGLVCVVAGFALYVAVDTGVIKFSHLRQNQKLSAHDLSSQLESVEEKVKARYASLKQADAQLEQVERRLQEERNLVQNLSEVIEVVEKQRLELEQTAREKAQLVAEHVARLDNKLQTQPRKRELDGPLSSKGSLQLDELDADLKRVARAAHSIGLTKRQISAINWDEREYLRLSNPFEYYRTGHYLSAKGVEEAHSLSKVIKSSEVAEVRVVFGSDSGASDTVERQRAITLRNHLRKLIDGDAAVTMMHAPSATVQAGTIEVWVTKE